MEPKAKAQTTRSDTATQLAEGPSSEDILIAIQGEIQKHLIPLGNTIRVLTDQVASLEAKVVERDTQVLNLEAKIVQRYATIAMLEESVSVLQSETDSLEQYGRRINFRVENIEQREDETDESLQEQVITTLQGAGAEIHNRDIFHMHRIGRPRLRQLDGKMAGQVIVRVNNWHTRTNVHLSRNAARASGHPVKQDLTTRRHNLIGEALDAIKSWRNQPIPVYAYANINCAPTIRRGRESMKFITDGQLQDALKHFKPAGTKESLN